MPTCSVEWCSNVQMPHAKGLCWRHYTLTRPRRVCAVELCGRMAAPGRRVCNGHRERKYRTGQYGSGLIKSHVAGRKCLVCGWPHYALGLCKAHYGRYKRRGRVMRNCPVERRTA